MRLSRAPALVLFLAVVAGPPGPSAAKDAQEAATELFAKGREALKKKDYAHAALYLDEAYVTSRSCLEACYLAAEAYEKLGDDRAAFLTYRLFVEGYDEQSAEVKLPAALATACRKAQQRMKSLGKVILELEEIRAEHVEALVAFAKEHAGTDPDVGVRALQRALEIAVNPKPVEDLISRLRPRVDVPEDRVPSPFEEDVVAWRDLIAERAFGVNPGWTYDFAILRVETAQGIRAHTSGKPFDSGPRYVYEVEGRVRELRGNMWVMGLLFGRNGDVEFSAVIDPQGLQVHRIQGGSRSCLTATRHAHDELDVWHRVSVKVDGSSLEAWVDGQKIFVADSGQVKDPLRGDYGLALQAGAFEIREIRIGVLE